MNGELCTLGRYPQGVVMNDRDVIQCPVALASSLSSACSNGDGA